MDKTHLYPNPIHTFHTGILFNKYNILMMMTMIMTNDDDDNEKHPGKYERQLTRDTIFQVCDDNDMKKKKNRR